MLRRLIQVTDGHVTTQRETMVSLERVRAIRWAVSQHEDPMMKLPVGPSMQTCREENLDMLNTELITECARREIQTTNPCGSLS